MRRRKQNEAPASQQEFTSLEESLQEAERITNLLLAAFLLIEGLFFLVDWLAFLIRYREIMEPAYPALFWGLFLTDACLFVISYYQDGRPGQLKPVLTFCAILNAVIMNLIHSDATIVYAMLIFFTSCYGSTRYTVTLTVSACLLAAVCTYCSERLYWDEQIADLMYFNFSGGADLHYEGWIITNLSDYMTGHEYAWTIMLRRCSTNMAALVVCGGCSVFIAKNNHRILRRQHEMDQRRAEADRRLSEAEAELNRNRAALAESNSRLLVSQIQPHFIFNILNTIYHLCEMDSELAQSAVADFSDYLRANLNTMKSREPVPFSVEREHLETYLRLEQMRFGRRLNVVWDIETEDFLLPALSVQPLVENAVKHGICRRSAGGTVRISTAEDEECCRIVVADDGVGFDTAAQLDETHVGLKNVRNRLEILSRAELDIQSTPGVGTVVTITIPKTGLPLPVSAKEPISG